MVRFGVWCVDFGIGVRGVQGSGFRVQGAGFRVQGLGGASGCGNVMLSTSSQKVESASRRPSSRGSAVSVGLSRTSRSGVESVWLRIQGYG